ncbi:hypothetical protein Daura_09410 [Dactylosporangium aurantiacum]|uniref:Transposase (putative) YhgA-like domain-containing protein n=1 Tax=Dactylosporangium aurantiacum TaxID=35754 RepID=A0A9Q9ML17_9ACTN|nr:hypothetical protein [Dactylosporangium aurantiacum]MDG6109501.1 hypothetical protein [Dactylosporangium aurantiacum]UWZ56366.1 hypothetical protein Daura_09410 [Dactylosporangium aurantiacum]
MPTQLHEMLIQMVRERPTLAAELLDGPSKVTVPDFDEARASPGDFTNVSPTEYRADAVVTLRRGSATVLAVVVEVQLRADVRKRRSWPVYVATLHARLECPVVLLVMCPARSVARWSSAPIRIGPPGSVVTPVTIGPDQVPVVTDLDTARRNPELAVLSALAHGGEPDPQPIFEALLTGLDVIDHEHAKMYTDLVFTVLPAAARDRLEALMTTTSYRYQSDFARRYFDEGKTEGKAEGEAMAVLLVLQARNIAVPDEYRALIAGCTDEVRLVTWLQRASVAETIHDLGHEFAH